MPKIINHKLDASNVRMLECLSKGMTFAEAAKQSGLKFRTAERRIIRLRQVTGAKNTPELVAMFLSTYHPAFNMLQKIQPELEHLINLTPTGKRRNYLCDLNIKALTILSNYEL